jgi:hypothetical protein
MTSITRINQYLRQTQQASQNISRTTSAYSRVLDQISFSARRIDFYYRLASLEANLAAENTNALARWARRVQTSIENSRNQQRRFSDEIDRGVLKAEALKMAFSGIISVIGKIGSTIVSSIESSIGRIHRFIQTSLSQAEASSKEIRSQANSFSSIVNGEIQKGQKGYKDQSQIERELKGIRGQLALAAAALPVSNQDILETFNVISDDLVREVYKGNLRKLEADVSNQGGIVGKLALLVKDTGKGFGGLIRDFNQFMSGDLQNVDFLNDVAANSKKFEESLKKIGSSSKGFGKLSGEKKLLALDDFLSKLFTQEYIETMANTLEGATEGLKSSLFDAESGIFGFARDIKIRNEKFKNFTQKELDDMISQKEPLFDQIYRVNQEYSKYTAKELQAMIAKDKTLFSKVYSRNEKYAQFTEREIQELLAEDGKLFDRIYKTNTTLFGEIEKFSVKWINTISSSLMAIFSPRILDWQVPVVQGLQKIRTLVTDRFLNPILSLADSFNNSPVLQQDKPKYFGEFFGRMLDKVISSTIDVATEIDSGLGDGGVLIETPLNRFVERFNLFFQQDIEKLGPLIQSILDKTGILFSRVWDTLSPKLMQFGEFLGGIWDNTIGPILGSAFSYSLDRLLEIGKWLWSRLEPHIGPFITSLAGTILKALYSLITSDWRITLGFFTITIGIPIAQSIANAAISAILRQIIASQMLQTAFNFLGRSLLPSVSSLGGSLLSFIAPAITSALSVIAIPALIAGVAFLARHFEKQIRAFFGSMESSGNRIFQVLGMLGNTITTWLVGLSDILVGIFTLNFDSIRLGFTKILQPIFDLFGLIRLGFIGLIDPIREPLNAIGNAVNSFLEPIRAFFIGLSETFSKQLQTFRDIMKIIGERITSLRYLFPSWGGEGKKKEVRSESFRDVQKTISTSDTQSSQKISSSLALISNLISPLPGKLDLIVTQLTSIPLKLDQVIISLLGKLDTLILKAGEIQTAIMLLSLKLDQAIIPLLGKLDTLILKAGEIQTAIVSLPTKLDSVVTAWNSGVEKIVAAIKSSGAGIGLPMGSGKAPAPGPRGGTGPFGGIASQFKLIHYSGYRPGDTDSYHGIGRAHDYSNGYGPTPQMMAFARYMAANYGQKLLELIYTPLGFSIKNGRRVPPYAQADHYDHVHVAYGDGNLNPLEKEIKKMPTGARPAIANTSETVLNRNQTKDLAQILTGRGNITMNISFNGYHTAREAAEAVAQEIQNAVNRIVYEAV